MTIIKCLWTSLKQYTEPILYPKIVVSTCFSVERSVWASFGKLLIHDISDDYKTTSKADNASWEMLYVTAHWRSLSLTLKFNSTCAIAITFITTVICYTWYPFSTIIFDITIIEIVIMWRGMLFTEQICWDVKPTCTWNKIINTTMHFPISCT